MRTHAKKTIFAFAVATILFFIVWLVRRPVVKLMEHSIIIPLSTLVVLMLLVVISQRFLQKSKARKREEAVKNKEEVRAIPPLLWRAGLYGKEAWDRSRALNEEVHKAVELVKSNMRKLWRDHPNKYVAVVDGKLHIVDQSEAESFSKLHFTHMTLMRQITDPDVVRMSGKEANALRKKARQILDDNIESLKRDHPGEWVVVNSSGILGISMNRLELINLYYREEYKPVLIIQLPKGEKK